MHLLVTIDIKSKLVYIFLNEKLISPLLLFGLFPNGHVIRFQSFKIAARTYPRTLKSKLMMSMGKGPKIVWGGPKSWLIRRLSSSES